MQNIPFRAGQWIRLGDSLHAVILEVGLQTVKLGIPLHTDFDSPAARWLLRSPEARRQCGYVLSSHGVRMLVLVRDLSDRSLIDLFGAGSGSALETDLAVAAQACG